MEEEKSNKEAIRLGVIKFMKKYMQDMDLMKAIVEQNSHAFDAKEDILKQFDMLKDSFQAVLDYNFYPIEINAVEGEYMVAVADK
jgi:molecular chaperone GrpE (heat shock protein)